MSGPAAPASLPARIDTAIVGAGHAGLAVSHFLKERRVEHLVLERHRVAERWRTRCWDSFTLVTPNWMLQLPGFHYAGPDPDGFLTRDEVIAHVERYAEQVAPPLRCGVEVARIEAAGDGLRLRTSAGDLQARNVVVATGPFQVPRVPEVARALGPGVLQLHASQYRSPAALPAGAVLVVGTGQSGAPIADELLDAGRTVYLSAGATGRLPRRYRGRDAMWWLTRMGAYDRMARHLPDPRLRLAAGPHVSGRGARPLELRGLARRGAVLAGRLTGAEGGRVSFADDLAESLAKADAFAAGIKRSVDDYVRLTRADAPEDDEPPPPPFSPERAPRALDLREAGIAAVIWATGFRLDFSWIDLPIFDGDQYPRHDRGRSVHPGLYFVGLPWLHRMKSALMFGISEDAGHVAACIAGEGGR